jgi:hypothetical protein
MQKEFKGELTTRDSKRYLPFRFDVPEGCSGLEITMTFEPAKVEGISNRLTLTLFDPDGFRGAGHRGGSTHEVRIDGETATPGYLPGPLPPGEWTVEIDTHMVMPGPAVRYQLQVDLIEGQGGSAGRSDEPVRRSQGIVSCGAFAPSAGRAGWYRGDLHTHSHHSDARDFAVADMTDLAQQYDLDFFFLTDHNTNAGLVCNGIPSDAGPGTPAVPLFCRGIELTTYWGHALCLGTDRWIDWRVRPGSGAMAKIADRADREGAVFIIAHPLAEGDPGCTGCAWRFGDMMPGNARFVEIWNGPWQGDSHNEDALALWYDWLNQGLRIVATAGTDVHGKVPAGVTPGFNVIYADALSEAALLDGLRAGHLYLSGGPEILLAAEDGRGERAIMGDTIRQPATFRVTWTAMPEGGEVRVLANGRQLTALPAGASGEHRWMMSPKEAEWVVAEARGEDGSLLAVTNPIFLALEGEGA